MGPHIIIHVGRYTSVAVFEGHLICYLYYMLDQSCFAQVQVAVHKQVFLFEQQFSGLLLLWFGPFFEALEVQGLQDPSLLGLVIGFLGSPCWEDYQWHLVARSSLNQPQSLWGFPWNGNSSYAYTDRCPEGPQI